MTLPDLNIKNGPELWDLVLGLFASNNSLRFWMKEDPNYEVKILSVGRHIGVPRIVPGQPYIGLKEVQSWEIVGIATPVRLVDLWSKKVRIIYSTNSKTGILQFVPDSYVAEIRDVWGDTHEYRLVDSDRTEVAKFHADVSAVWGINAMLRKLGEKECIEFDVPPDPKAAPMAEDP